MYPVGEKTRPIPYSGRGRPPKRAVMGGVAGEGGESSDEGEEGEEDGGGVASDSDYSEEPTDEEVCFLYVHIHVLCCLAIKFFISTCKYLVTRGVFASWGWSNVSGWQQNTK